LSFTFLYIFHLTGITHFLGGTPPGDGMALTLQHTMGLKRASYFAYTGKKTDGNLAVELGIANEVLSRKTCCPGLGN
jgi:enoyl-CoA hydratase/carnithine racemase